MTDSTYASAGGSGRKSLAWTAVGLAGRQITIVVFSLVLARMLGPEAYGIVAQATVFMTLTTLLLDQGLSAALISASQVTRRTAGAAVTVNLLLALALALITVALARPMALFFSTPELQPILTVLAGTLFFKAAAVVPRMLLARSFRFRGQAVVDVSAALLGGTAALLATLWGAGYWSLVVQLVVSDVIIAFSLLAIARPPLPNLKFALLRESLGFSSRAFGSSLISYTVQNIDNILIGRVFGPDALAQYALAYRVLTTPLQMVSQVVTRVLFPAVARARHRGQSAADLVATSVRGISLITFPAMAFIAASANESVPLILGDEWTGAIPILIILAVSGARQSVTTVNTPTVLGMGRADVALKFSLVAASVQITGMILGISLGPVGVAAGFAISGFLLTPIICLIQRRIGQLSLQRQWSSVWPALHATLWATLTYLCVGLLTENTFIHLVVGAIAAAAIYVTVLLVGHRASVAFVIETLKSIVAKPRGGSAEEPA